MQTAAETGSDSACSLRSPGVAPRGKVDCDDGDRRGKSRGISRQLQPQRLTAMVPVEKNAFARPPPALETAAARRGREWAPRKRAGAHPQRLRERFSPGVASHAVFLTHLSASEAHGGSSARREAAPGAPHKKRWRGTNIRGRNCANFPRVALRARAAKRPNARAAPENGRAPLARTWTRPARVGCPAQPPRWRYARVVRAQTAFARLARRWCAGKAPAGPLSAPCEIQSAARLRSLSRNFARASRPAACQPLACLPCAEAASPNLSRQPCQSLG